MKNANFRSGGRLVSLFILSLAISPPIATPADENTASADQGQATAEDPAEVAAFAAMVNDADQHRRRDMAERFLFQYPQSWRLAPVYEIAAKSSIAVGDFRAAIEFGAKSLRILPENPFLLLPLADAQTRLGQYDAARRSAEDAVWYLSRFDRPSSIDENAWPQLKRHYQTEAWFDAGRAAAAEAFAAAGPLRTSRFADAEKALLHALSFDTGAGAAYLLGMVYLGDMRSKEAATAFALAAKTDGPVRAQAMNQLQAIYAEIASGQSFDAWLASLDLPLPKTAEVPRSVTARKSAYAGSAACQECHASLHAEWHATGMGRMFRSYASRDVIGDFASGEVLPDDKGEPAARPIVEGGRHYMELREGEKWKRYPVDYLIGSKWQQGYATRLKTGEIQVFPLQYNRLEKRWVNYWKIIDPAESPRTDISRFGERDPGATYQLQCAPCHTSQEHFESGVYRAQSASFREGGINCEMCHGPSANHVAAMRHGVHERKDPAESPVDFKRLPASQYVAICSQCHMQSGDHIPEKTGAMNYSEQGPDFYRVLSSRPFVDYSRRAFYKDGRFRETVFIVESFERSSCFRKGGATCGACHDPHPPDAAKNPTSLKFVSDSDRMCLGCHEKFRTNPEAHTHHPSSAEAARCVSCHMPRIMNALLFKARNHRIDDIPDAAMAVRFGPAESPNACLLCHTDKDTVWLTGAMRLWKS